MLVAPIKNHRYELIAFMTGAAVMTLEIVGARLIAPYFGTSIFVWTAMIGVILGSLAIGYAVGGRMADKDNAPNSLPLILIIAAALVLVLGLLQANVLGWLAGQALDLRISAFLAATLLFSAPSLLIGMVSPHLAKIRVVSLDTTGKSVGRLEAAGALGSIAGTFACGYVLLGFFGSRSIVLGVALLLLLTSLLAGSRQLNSLRLLLVGMVGLQILLPPALPTGVVADIDTSYARYKVQDIDYNGEPVTTLSTDGRGTQSAVNQNNPDKLVFSYIQQFDAALHRTQNVDSILVIGGGTFTFPAAAARQNPNLQVDVVEIDPALTKISKDYFYLKSLPNLNIINQDGRTYLNSTDRSYDMVFLDAYNALNPPFQLTTKETLQRVRERLSPTGVVVSNVIGRFDGYNDRYLQAMRATIASVFPYAQAHPTLLSSGDPDSLRNHVIFGSRSLTALNAVTKPLESSPIPVNPDALVLRDDFAPIEHLAE